jgi:hypothetical protein
MKKGNIHIHMMNFPFKASNEGNNQSNRVHLCNGGKGFSVVDAFLLIKSICNEARFMSLKNTLRGKFGQVDP